LKEEDDGFLEGKEERDEQSMWGEKEIALHKVGGE
jgi:hypothetical protein